jgi:hypothetical protein
MDKEGSPDNAMKSIYKTVMVWYPAAFHFIGLCHRYEEVCALHFALFILRNFL